MTGRGGGAGQETGNWCICRRGDDETVPAVSAEIGRGWSGYALGLSCIGRRCRRWLDSLTRTILRSRTHRNVSRSWSRWTRNLGNCFGGVRIVLVLIVFLEDPSTLLDQGAPNLPVDGDQNPGSATGTDPGWQNDCLSLPFLPGHYLTGKNFQTTKFAPAVPSTITVFAIPEASDPSP